MLTEVPNLVANSRPEYYHSPLSLVYVQSEDYYVRLNEKAVNVVIKMVIN
jgi:hypothetical protein